MPPAVEPGEAPPLEPDVPPVDEVVLVEPPPCPVPMVAVPEVPAVEGPAVLLSAVLLSAVLLPVAPAPDVDVPLVEGHVDDPVLPEVPAAAVDVDSQPAPTPSVPPTA